MRRLILALVAAAPLFVLASPPAAASGWCDCGCRGYGYYGYSSYAPYYGYRSAPYTYRPYYRPRFYSGGYFYRPRAWGWRGYGYRSAGWRGYGYRAGWRGYGYRGWHGYRGGWRGGRRW